MARRLSRNTAPESPAPIGDNSAAVEEGARVQLISIMSQYDAALGELEVAQAPVKAARKKLSSIKGLAKAAGIPAWQLEARHDEMQRPTFENAANAEAEAKQRKWLGIITPEQQKMFTGGDTPQETQDEGHWAGEGYKAGLLNKAAQLPEAIPERFVQVWLKAHGDGRKSFLLTIAENVPKPKGMTAQQVAEQAARDFAEDQAAERASIRKAKESLDAMVPVITDEDPLGVNDGFELSEEEIAAQKPRKAIQEANAADDVVV